MLKLAAVISYDEFEDTLRDAVSKTLPGVVSGLTLPEVTVATLPGLENR